jgi:DNA-binding NarL/FixJ family response regulator
VFSFGELMDALPHIVPDDTVQLTALTERQRQVVALVCQGLSNKSIAEKLGLSEGTVKVHLHAIFEKLDVHSRTHIMVRFGTPWRVAGRTRLAQEAA